MRVDAGAQLAIAGEVDVDRWRARIELLDVGVGRDLVVVAGALDEGGILRRGQTDDLHLPLAVIAKELGEAERGLARCARQHDVARAGGSGAGRWSCGRWT